MYSLVHLDLRVLANYRHRETWAIQASRPYETPGSWRFPWDGKWKSQLKSKAVSQLTKPKLDFVLLKTKVFYWWKALFATYFELVITWVVPQSAYKIIDNKIFRILQYIKILYNSMRKSNSMGLNMRKMLCTIYISCKI